jgi:hypothetical protein
MRIAWPRIDAATEAALARLRRRACLTDARRVRRAPDLVSQRMKPVEVRRVRGIGRFASGRSDLGSNKACLSGFGRS